MKKKINTQKSFHQRYRYRSYKTKSSYTCSSFKDERGLKGAALSTFISVAENTLLMRTAKGVGFLEKYLIW